MEAFVIVAVVGIGLLIAELMLPTGGVLATLGVLALIAGGVLAETADSGSTAAEVLGPALIALGIVSGITVYFVTRKVIAAQRDEPVRTGSEEMIGSHAEVRSTLDPDGQVWIGGALWRARLAGDAAAARPGDRVVVQALDGLTLVVEPESPTQKTEAGGR